MSFLMGTAAGGLTAAAVSSSSIITEYGGTNGLIQTCGAVRSDLLWFLADIRNEDKLSKQRVRYHFLHLNADLKPPIY